MEIRKFESFSLQDAIKLVKLELGRDAVILSTKEKEIYSEELQKNCRIYEVTASPSATVHGKVINPKSAEHLPKVDFPRIKPRNEATVVKGDPTPNRQKNSLISPTLSTLNQETRNMARSLASALTKEPAKERLFAKETINVTSSSEMNEQTLEEMNVLKSEISKVRKELESLPQVDITEQMQEIKVLLHDIMREKYKKSTDNGNSYVTDIGIRLRSAGVSENFISHLTTWLNTLEDPKNKEDLINSPEKTKEFYLSSAIKFIFKYLKVTGPFRVDKNKKKVVCFVGPTGVGKTTTLAKIAAKLKLTDSADVEMISMDSYRIAASDQLRVYSKILDCHFAEISDKNELVNYISKHNNYDYILIDTAGRSSRFSDQMETLKRLAEAPLPIEFHLVLSCTMKQRDIDETIRGFRFLTPSSLIFTKLDESWAFGEILNTSVQNKLPLSYFTTGQRVPEDIEIASKERVVERLLKL
ncbi:flagellar biosynthesis protein FlhF [Pigmentibacter sp. JX0631]|uniref:flagellar biosynthesis protein FlhF n=1 Tax=Pigmentibacter sp. JX0631 TaxID=2976982 RepID=UPI00246930B5|nr:flagellar biosynthesis protein FlhF [Pigmentibacter sp. JX0631]WGL58688.1 flagellar biosynthesis protein FlhF [Pigmentibacter sp. JX0631]